MVRDGIIAGVVAAVVSGAPSTAHAIVTGADPLAATAAAGSLLLPGERRTGRLLLAAVPVHLAISVGWAVVLERVLGRRANAGLGAVAGLAIAAVDLRLPGRRFARVRELPVGPQVADHLVYGAVVGAVLRYLSQGSLRRLG